MTAFASPRGAWRAFILALAFAAGTAQGSLLFGAVGLANDQYARPVADTEIASTAVLADCRGFVGTIARIVLLDGSIRCNEAFPYGFASRRTSPRPTPSFRSSPSSAAYFPTPATITN